MGDSININFDDLSSKARIESLEDDLNHLDLSEEANPAPSNEAQPSPNPSPYVQAPASDNQPSSSTSLSNDVMTSSGIPLPRNWRYKSDHPLDQVIGSISERARARSLFREEKNCVFIS